MEVIAIDYNWIDREYFVMIVKIFNGKKIV